MNDRDLVIEIENILRLKSISPESKKTNRIPCLDEFIAGYMKTIPAHIPENPDDGQENSFDDMLNTLLNAINKDITFNVKKP